MYALARYKLLLHTFCVNNFQNSKDQINEMYHRNVRFHSWNSLFRINILPNFLWFTFFFRMHFKENKKIQKTPKGLDLWMKLFFSPHKSQVSNLKKFLGSCIFLTSAYVTDCRIWFGNISCFRFSQGEMLLKSFWLFSSPSF